jgi:hypothetical protein
MNILLLRHARNDYHGDNAGKLGTAGIAFAQFLVTAPAIAAMGDSITGIWSSDAARCVDTVKPLSDTKGLPIRKFGDSMGLDRASAVAAKLKASTSPGWAVICTRSIELDVLQDEGILPGCASAIASCYERYRTYSGQTPTNREYSRIQTWAHAANVVYTGEQWGSIQKKK